MQTPYKHVGLFKRFGMQCDTLQFYYSKLQ